MGRRSRLRSVGRVLMDWTVADLRQMLDDCPADAPLWVLDVHPDGFLGETFHVVNAHMDSITRRATIIVEPLGGRK